MIRYLMMFILGLASMAATMPIAAVTEQSDKLERGNVLAKQGQYGEALQMMNQVIAENPINARAYKIRGHIYYAMGDYQSALTDLDHVVVLVPGSANALVDRAIVYSVMGNHGLALADVERALALKPSSSFAQAVRNEVLERARQ